MNFNGLDIDFAKIEKTEEEALKYALELEAVAKRIREEVIISYKNRIQLIAMVN